jgi:hypothetical protein
MERTDLSHLPYAEFVGWSPGGIEWVAYEREKVRPMRARLEAMWEKRLGKAPRYDDPVIRTAKLTAAQAELVGEELGRLGGDPHLHAHALMCLKLGRTYLRGPAWAMRYVAEGIDLDDDWESRVGENTYHELTEANIEFGARARERCARGAVQALLHPARGRRGRP